MSRKLCKIATRSISRVLFLRIPKRILWRRQVATWSWKVTACVHTYAEDLISGHISVSLTDPGYTPLTDAVRQYTNTLHTTYICGWVWCTKLSSRRLFHKRLWFNRCNSTVSTMACRRHNGGSWWYDSHCFSGPWLDRQRVEFRGHLSPARIPIRMDERYRRGL
jgi:hypothetical protein